MRLPFRRKQPRRAKQPQVRNKAFDLRRSSDKTIKRRKLSKVNQTISGLREKRSILYSVMGALLLGVVIFALSSLLTSDTFTIKSITFVGNNTITETELSAETATFLEDNIFLTRTSTIRDTLLASELYFEEVEVQKFLPDKVRVTLRERQPNITLINFAGAFLTDDDGTIVEVIARGDINLSEDDINIIKGLGNPNADYVRRRMQLDRAEDQSQRENEQQETDTDTDTEDNTPPEQERESDLNFTKTPLSRKVATLDQVRSELLSKASEIHSNYATQASQSIYAGLPRVYVYATDSYEINDSVDLARLELTNEARRFFAAMEAFIIERVTWESPFIVTFTFTNGKTVTFSTQRDYGEQLEDFAIIHEQLRIRGDEYTTMDLSSSKVSVK